MNCASGIAIGKGDFKRCTANCEGTKCPSSASCSICRDATLEVFCTSSSLMVFSNRFDGNKAAFLAGLPNDSCFLFARIFVSAIKSSESQKQKSVIPKQKGEFAVHLLKSPIPINTILNAQLRFDQLLMSCCLAILCGTLVTTTFVKDAYGFYMHICYSTH